MFRVDPQMPTTQYKTYQVITPRDTRRVSCAEFECEQHSRGWVTTVPRGSDLERMVRLSGRKWLGNPEPTEDGNIRFTFPPGTHCFAESTHVKQVNVYEKPEIYVVRDGDWRGNPTGRAFKHRSGQDWVDDFGEHQERLADRLQRG